MVTAQQKHIAFSTTRIVIFVLIILGIYLPPPIGDFLGVIAAAMWLWLPRLIAIELKLIDRWSDNG